MVRVLFALLCTLSVVLAQGTSIVPSSSSSALPQPLHYHSNHPPNTPTDTGPPFDPGNAPFFGQSGLVIPTLSTAMPSLTTSTASRNATMSTSMSRNATMSQTMSRNATSSSASILTTSSSAVRTTSASRTASASASAVSTGAAVVNGQGVMGVIAGGLIAGLAWL
jgi:hypothetical protein